MTLTRLNTIEEARRATAAARRQGRTIGLVPTMGALHAGHVSLLRAARQETSFVVVSIFVNPTQFGPNEDLSRYPRPLENDLKICATEGVDVAFVPETADMYPPESLTFVEVTKLQDGLCGASRPGHFRGVATVVLKLFNIVQPDVAFFGQKDAQQACIIERMAADLNVPVRVRVCPIVRENDGLALSSRNVYLTPEQRRHAVILSRSLAGAHEMIRAGERGASVVQRYLAERIRATPGAELDYAAVVDARSLRPIEVLQGDVLLALAVKFGATRLIDNVKILSVSVLSSSST